MQILGGTVSEITSTEHEVFSPNELRAGWRLACHTFPTSDCKVSVPPESMTTPQRLQMEGLEIVVPPEPVRSDEVVSVGKWPSRQLGMAVDLGTTKIAGYLLDLSDGQTLAVRGVMNPQVTYG